MDGTNVAKGVSQYLHEIGEHELLLPQEELDLARDVARAQSASRKLATESYLPESARAELQRAANMGARSCERLIESNLRLVVSIARHYQGLGLSLEDLIQEGNLGLETGVEHFDWRKGFRLSTYVYWWIRQAIVRALANQSRLIRLPVHAGELLAQAARVEQELGSESGIEPTVVQVAAKVGITPGRLQALRDVAASPASLDTPLTPDGDLTAAEVVSDPVALADIQQVGEARDLADGISAALNGLDPREREVLELHYGLRTRVSCTLAEVGARFGFTRERARQIEGQALRKLRGDAGLRRLVVEGAA